uniref:Uncharacterized protein n=1 Tax=Glossina palpalis gambiensis TaxID=67801 RepID=A0A1B0B0A0_9MUSC
MLIYLARFSGKYFRRTLTISTGNAEQSSRLNIFGDPELGIHVVTLQAMENSIFTLCRYCSTVSPIVIVLRSTSTIRNAPSVVDNARNVLGFLDMKSEQPDRAAWDSSTAFFQNCLGFLDMKSEHRESAAWYSND